MLSLIAATLCCLSAMLGFVAVTALLKWFEEREKGYCEFCGQYKHNVILWIRDGTIHHICEECLKEGAICDTQNK